jgi:site-specific DNA recombinase
MLLNETYAGTRYFNRLTRDKSAAPEGAKLIHGKFVSRDRAEWIPVQVPAIVSRELFDTVQAKLRLHDQRYCRPVTHYLLGGLIQCGFCEARASSARGWHRVPRPSGKICVYHRAEYRCNRRASENLHDRTRIKRCRNSSISTHILEGKVSEMIRETMLDPTKLRFCIDINGGLDDRSIGRKLSRLAGEIAGLEDERRRIIDQYAVDQITGEEYIAANRDLDRQQEQLTQKKAALIAALRSPQEDFVDASIRQFCATGNARLRACTDFDTKRQFLKDHVERVIFNGYRITITGSVPVRSIAGETTLQFRIEGEISKMQVRANPTRMTMEKQGHVPKFGRTDTLPASNPI